MERDEYKVEKISEFRRLNKDMGNNNRKKKPREPKITPEMKVKHDKMSDILFDKLYKEDKDPFG